MRDGRSNFAFDRAISPVDVTDNTAQVSEIIDLMGYDSCTVVFGCGTIADAGAEFTPLLEEGDESDLSDNSAVADADMVPSSGAEAFFTEADDDEVYSISYIGSKRYIRLTITPTNNAASAPIAAFWVRGKPALAPVTQTDTPTNA
jgi:hypothetical protein